MISNIYLDIENILIQCHCLIQNSNIGGKDTGRGDGGKIRYKKMIWNTYLVEFRKVVLNFQKGLENVLIQCLIQNSNIERTLIQIEGGKIECKKRFQTPT